MSYDIGKPSSQGVHSCKLCPRTFTTKGSLHRHERNHDHNNSFTCSICEVSFRRRDLLTRHAGMHDSNDEVITGQQRARTACNPCRQARTRCSGDAPCSRCTRKNISCLFTISSARTSCDSRPTTFDLQLSVAAGDACIGDDSQTPLSTMEEGQDETAIDVGIGQEQSVIQPLDLPGDINSIEDQITPTSIAWPWLHENLFLREDLNLDWYDLQCGLQGADDTMPVAQYHQSQPGVAPNQMGGMMRVQHHGLGSRVLDCQTQEAAINGLVTTACDFDKLSLQSGDRRINFYEGLPNMAGNVAVAFDIDVPHLIDLQYYVDLYLSNFWLLWPLSPRQHFTNNQFEPILYLAMVSIGAMYGDKKSSSFGTSLHNRLREELIRPALEMDISEKLMLPLGQARVLTQAAALYFGHQRAFSYASHLGGALVVQARKMNLFAPTRLAPNVISDDTTRWVKSWVNRESRIRLSFAILRLEMYTSALFMTRPLLSGREMDITLPCSKYVWTTAFSSIDSFAAAIEQDRHTSSQPFIYSDLLSILLEPEEELPHVDILHGELLVNALQEEVWSASTSKLKYSRLAPSTFVTFDSGLTVSANHYEGNVMLDSSNGLSLDSHLTCNMKMKSLVDQIHKTTSALRKSREHILRRHRTHGVELDAADRSSIFSCLLAYHLGFLQLHAPVAAIQQACHHQSRKDFDEIRNAEVVEWARTEEAKMATTHAVHIYHLLRAETQKSNGKRARVNFLTMLGLYHSATVLYAYSIFNSICDEVPTHPSTDDFVTIFRELNPAWAARSSFSNMLQTLR